MIRTCSIVGLGKLGASMTAAIAKRGLDVIGVDVSERSVDLVNRGRAPVQETGLDQLLGEHRARIRATTSHREAVHGSEITFVIVPTPSEVSGSFSLTYAASAFREIGRALADKKEYHTVVLTSTVLPGATRYGLIPIMEAESGKVCGQDFGLCYSPEFIALGSVIRDFLNPDFTLIGEFDQRSGDILEECYSRILENHAPARRMSIENAELTKVSLNTYVTTKITFANMLADLCERIPGGDVDVVTNALGSDTRVGSKYIKGALGYGGPCFPRDSVALSYFAQAVGTRADLAETTDRSNRALAPRAARRVLDLVPHGSTVAVLGLAYKPYSHVVEESQGMALARALADAGARVVTYDPLAGPSARAELPATITVADSIRACLEGAATVLITTPDPEFVALNPSDFLVAAPGVLVLDFWRVLDGKLAGQPNIRYLAFGRSEDDSVNAERLIRLWGSSGSRSAQPLATV